MVVDAPLDEHRVDRVFRALSDATRRDILAAVLQEEQRVSDIADRYPMSFAAVQKHVAVLERAGLVTKRRQGREQHVLGNVDAVRRAQELLNRLEQVWYDRVARIVDILDDPDLPDKRQGGTTA